MPIRTAFRSELDAAVAEATGEDLSTIRRRGFSLVELDQPEFDPEPDLRAPQYVDWDELDHVRHSQPTDFWPVALRRVS